MKTSVVAVDADLDLSIAILIPHTNSIFAAVAITHLPSANRIIFLLADSFTSQSSSVLLSPFFEGHSSSDSQHFGSYKMDYSITLVLCSAHKVFTPNEKSDHLAKEGPFLCQSLPWISLEDLRSHFKKSWIIENECLWMNSTYVTNSPPSFDRSVVSQVNTD